MFTARCTSGSAEGAIVAQDEDETCHHETVREKVRYTQGYNHLGKRLCGPSCRIHCTTGEWCPARASNECMVWAWAWWVAW